jgi:hypothetical protein
MRLSGSRIDSTLGATSLQPYSRNDNAQRAPGLQRVVHRGAASQDLYSERVGRDHLAGHPAQQLGSRINDDGIVVHQLREHTAGKNNQRYAQAQAQQQKEAISLGDRP